MLRSKVQDFYKGATEVNVNVIRVLNVDHVYPAKECREK